MRVPIRPGKVACAGIVAIFMVLPNSIWKGPDAKVAPVPKQKIDKVQQTLNPRDSARGSRNRRVQRQSSGRSTTYPSR